jgi:hypothetical protein
VMGAVLKTVGARYPGPAGSIPVRLRHTHSLLQDRKSEAC